MRTVRGVTVTALSTVLAFALMGVLGTQLSTIPAASAVVTPTWQTTAGYRPLADVSAVSCAPSATASSATCVAVGDDGGNVASVIVTQNGVDVVGLDSPSRCDDALYRLVPVVRRVLRRRRRRIMKSSNGGANWTMQDSSFPAQSISCFTIECTAVEGVQIVSTIDVPLGPLRHRRRDRLPLFCVMLDAITCAAVGLVGGAPAVIGTLNGNTWTTIGRPSVNFLRVFGVLYIDDLRGRGRCLGWRSNVVYD